MDANFSVVTLQASPQTEIWVEDDYKGSGHAEVKLEFGSYKVETRRQSHQSTSQLLQINGPIAQTIILKEPIPMYGSSSVETEPSGAKVFIDDIFRGETPVILNGILIGEHTIRFEKDGYAHKTQSINIEHNKTTLCHENLSKEACISFDANGGNGNMSPFIVTVGEEKRLPANRFSKENLPLITLVVQIEWLLQISRQIQFCCCQISN